VVATEQAKLLSGPEAKTDRVVDCIAGELFGDLEDANNARAIVVDAGAVKDGIRVATDDKDRILVASDSFGDDVLSGKKLLVQ
jgi:hypothetical protein